MGRAKTTRLFANESFSAEMSGDLSSVLSRFENGVYEHVLRSTAYAGASVFYHAMRAGAPVKKGILRDSIYHWYDDKNSTPKVKIYLIGPNKGKAKHWYNVEYGHWRINESINFRWTTVRLPQPVWTPAHPYIRPAFYNNVNVALSAMRLRSMQKIKELSHSIASGTERVKELA